MGDRTYNTVRLDLENDLEDTVLCFVENADFPRDIKDAYFTSISLAEQKGMDWDRPLAEAGSPDSRAFCGKEKKYVMVGRQWLLVRVTFRCDVLKSPVELLGKRCSYSANAVNARQIPWLSSADKKIKIFAGTTFEQFLEKIRELGADIQDIAIAR